MQTLYLSQLLSTAGRRMSDDLRERLLTHPAELGTDREEILRRFLRAYLPKRFEVSTGFVFDSSGNVSKQLDIIIADSQICPRFETQGGKQIFPCEAVVAVGQVKSSLTSTGQFYNALENLESVKKLDRSAQGQSIDKTYKEHIDNRFNYLHQIFTFLFVIDNALSAKRVAEELLENVTKQESHLWPNIIIALDQYLITYACDNGVCPNPVHARGIAVQVSNKNQDNLLRFYLLLGQAIEVIRVSSLPYWEYLNEFHSWSADVFYAATGDPPPFLSNIIRG